MEELDTKKIKDSIYQLKNDDVNTVRKICSTRKDIKLLSEDLEKYTNVVLENYCKNDLLETDLFKNKYPYSTIEINYSNHLRINPIGSNFNVSFCYIDTAENNFTINDYKTENLLSNYFTESTKEKADKLQDEIDFWQKKLINPTNDELRILMKKEAIGCFKKFKFIDGFQGLHMSFFGLDDNFNKTRDNYKRRIISKKEQFDKYNNEYNCYSNIEMLMEYVNYIKSFKKDLTDSLISYGFVKKESEYLIPNNFLLFTELIYKNDTEFQERVKAKRLINNFKS